MTEKRLRFESVEPMDPNSWIQTGQASPISQFLFQGEESILEALRSATGDDAYILRAELVHRKSRYINYGSEELLSMAESYLNGKTSMMIDRGSPAENFDEIIDIDSLLQELEYRGIHVLDFDIISDAASIKNIGDRIIEEKQIINDILKFEAPKLRAVKGVFVYNHLGEKRPLRNATVKFQWYGSHPTKSDFSNESATEQNGYFSDNVPDGLLISSLNITVSVSKSSEKLSFNASELHGSKGDLGEIVLSRDYSEYEGLMERLDNLTSDMENVVKGQISQDQPSIILGEGEGMFALDPGTTSSKYTYKMLHRLIEPEMVGAEEFADLAVYFLENKRYIRRPISGPIDLDKYRKVDTFLKAKMGSLGIGYVLSMQQEWKPSHFSLGTLLYSVALAPGEEQRIIVTERSESYEVKDTEMLSSDTSEEYGSRQSNDISSVFQRAMNEHTFGRTDMKSVTKGTSLGLLFSMYASHSTTKTTVDSSSYQSGSRDEATSYSESFNESITREAQKQRNSSRIGIRMATSEESATASSKIIANHNHSHALTMQYWEVVRNYLVTTRISDVKMVCYIPFEIIRFLPLGQSQIIDPRKLMEETKTEDTAVKKFFYDRYSTALKYYDAIFSDVPYKYRNGLRLMKEYATYPDWDFQQIGENKPTTLNLTLNGSFMSYHRISARLRLKNGKGWVSAYPTNSIGVEKHTAKNRSDLVAQLVNKKNSVSNSLTFDLNIPPGVKNDDYDWLEIEVSYPYDAIYPVYFTPDEITWKQMLMTNDPALKDLDKDTKKMISMIQWTPSELRLNASTLKTIGSPLIKSVKLFVKSKVESSSSPSTVSGFVEKIETVMVTSFTEELISRLAYKIYDDKPTMSFEELQQIESAFQHIVENTVPYSQSVWGNLTAEERAMLFEQYTIAAPRAGEGDIGHEIPLANCIENTVEGFYGNCMIVPFSYPSEIANALNTSSKRVQDALFAYHTEAYRAPETMISMPAGGMIGEAVLGGSNASEKVDLTRFWNWQDSPIDSAPGISMKDLKGISLLADASAPNGLVALQQESTIGKIVATAVPDVTAELSKEGASFDDITNTKAASEHMTAIAKKASEERANAVTQSAVIAKAAIKVAKAATGGGAGDAAKAAGTATNKAPTVQKEGT